MAPRTGQMTDAHKAALAEGRGQVRAVRAYLEAIAATKPTRGRKRTPDSMRSRLAVIDTTIEEAEPMTRLQLAQERIDLQKAVKAAETPVDLTALEDAFVDVASRYADRKGIGYAAWREVGVPTAVLRRAGITRA